MGQLLFDKTKIDCFHTQFPVMYDFANDILYICNQILQIWTTVSISGDS